MKMRFTWLVVAAVVVGSYGIHASSDEGTVIEVVGQNNVLVDRPNLQAAIDAAPEGATIHIRGVFQLDGWTILISRSHLTIAGVANGNSHPVLKGLLGPLGNPLGDIPMSATIPNTSMHFNRGIAVASIDGGVVEDITLRGFSMTGLNRAIAVQSFYADTNLCGAANSGIEARNVRIENLQMDNVIRGVQTFGSVRSLTVLNTEVAGALANGILLNSGGVACFDEEDGRAGSFFEGSLVGAEIRNNDLATGGQLAVPHPFEAIGPSTDVLVMGNTFTGGAAAVHLNGPATNVVVRNNQMIEGGTQGSATARFGGVRMTAASGFELTNNDYAGNVASDTLPSATLVPRDVWLFFAATGNTVTERRGTIVLDWGTGNTVTIRGS